METIKIRLAGDKKKKNGVGCGPRIRRILVAHDNSPDPSIFLRLEISSPRYLARSNEYQTGAVLADIKTTNNGFARLCGHVADELGALRPSKWGWRVISARS